VQSHETVVGELVSLTHTPAARVELCWTSIYTFIAEQRRFGVRHLGLSGWDQVEGSVCVLLFIGCGGLQLTENTLLWLSGSGCFWFIQDALQQSYHLQSPTSFVQAVGHSSKAAAFIIRCRKPWRNRQVYYYLYHSHSLTHGIKHYTLLICNTHTHTYKHTVDWLPLQ